MRLLYFGMNGVFSYLPLAAILRAKAEGTFDWLAVSAVVLPSSAVINFESTSPVKELLPERPQSEIPLVRPYLEETVIHLAWANDIPVYVVQGMKSEGVRSFMKEMAPDIACAACFPYRIPVDILAIPGHGFLNIHPSLLPAYRGPAPLFWIFRNGERKKTGVTLHWMAEGLDSGDILSQRGLTLVDGISGPEADSLSAAVGGDMLLAGLTQIREGKVVRERQADSGSYHSWPKDEDFRLESGWSARRAFNFMRGTAEWNHSYTLEMGPERFTLVRAEAFNPEEVLGQAFEEKDGMYRIQFTPGVLEAS